MILNFSLKLMFAKGKLFCRFSLYKRYRVMSTAPLDVLWYKLINVADVSWHPLFSKTNVPLGLMAKPGLIYKAVTRLTPIPVRLFVENVRPGELLSLRVLTIPGMEQKITYQVESTLCGTYISYSVTLKGWLSPLIWWLIKPYSARVATELAQAAEQRLA
ncbi:polyketide cyclase / dehydrase and lipid transport [Cyanothece sp. BG0011]|uniref:polyketide cyclase / dehydrase and lipid transport n=1 Tax=Cyanothece sp. BG0011 TaxID=2082950 RepID=UPI000D1F3FB8|nr:polyketide cyclase / dehydrase and lipid transport [Cyanothece sp. BG0011]